MSSSYTSKGKPPLERQLGFSFYFLLIRKLFCEFPSGASRQRRAEAWR